jgi:hypothetical protein
MDGQQSIQSSARSQTGMMHRTVERSTRQNATRHFGSASVIVENGVRFFGRRATHLCTAGEITRHHPRSREPRDTHLANRSRHRRNRELHRGNRHRQERNRHLHRRNRERQLGNRHRLSRNCHYHQGKRRRHRRNRHLRAIEGLQRRRNRHLHCGNRRQQPETTIASRDFDENTEEIGVHHV